MTLPAYIARLLGDAAEETARGLGIPVAAAIADSAGNPVFFSRMDDVLVVSLELARTKAYTASALRLPTSKLAELAKPGGELYGIEHVNPPVTLVGGGEPLMLGGAVIGGIGVSGGTVAQDVTIARAAVDVLTEMERLSISLGSLAEAVRPADAPIGAVESILAVKSRELGLSRINVLTLSGAVYLALEAVKAVGAGREV